MYIGKLDISSGDIAKVAYLGEEGFGPQYIFYAPTLDALLVRAREVVSNVKFVAKANRAPGVQAEVDKILDLFKEKLEGGSLTARFETPFDPYDDANAYLSWSASPYSKYDPVVEVVTPSTLIDRINVMGDTDVHKNLDNIEGSREFLLKVVRQMPWNCLKDEKFAEELYTAFDVNGLILDEKGVVESVSVHDPRATEWGVYGRISDSTAFALHDCDTLEDALTRATLLARIYQ